MEEADTVPVSIKAPFLSNLLVIDNIKLVMEVKERSLQHNLHEIALDKLRVLGIEAHAFLHFTALDDSDYFLVQLVRAAMVPDVRIIIDRPFSMVSGQSDMDFIVKPLEALNIEFDRVTILELSASKHYIKEDICDVTKWQ